MLKKQDNIINSHIVAERAIDELRRQMGIIIDDGNGHAVANYPVEFLNEEILSALRSPLLRILITAARAKSLGLAAQASKIDAAYLSLPQILALCDPTADQSALPQITAIPASDIDAMALKLAKYASLLPALLLIKVDEASLPAAWQRITVTDIQNYLATPLVDIIPTAHASLPLEGAENCTIMSFRSRYATAVHLALVIGDIKGVKAPLTRIHSSCVTGDILGSLRCDCGDQLKLALEQLSHEGCGILVYLHQEGRGIGITNKLRAYRLQEQGVDTYDANLMLGFAEDERDFAIAAAILKTLNVGTIRMLTNNPHKIAALEQSGIKVAERVPLIVKTGRHNHAYLDAKAKKSGHLF